MIANTLMPWAPTNTVPMTSSPALTVAFAPDHDPTLQDIIQQATVLSSHNRKALAKAFDFESYEMAAIFTWAKAMAELRKQVAALGMEFVGEILGRPELDETSSPMIDIREDEAIEVAEQLNAISTAEAIRLRNGQVLINHFLDSEESQNDEMQREEALCIVRSCMVNFLTGSHAKTYEPFLSLREKLVKETFKVDDQVLAGFDTAPYFFVRMTLTTLLAQLKTAVGDKLEQAAENTAVLLPLIWPRLRDRDRWQAGETNIFVQTFNRRPAIRGLGQALLSAQGIDFIPGARTFEIFRIAAREVFNAHFCDMNFRSEVKPMANLVQFGSTVPNPALHLCLGAALCVRLGNRYGHSPEAQPFADSYLKLFRPSQWEHYFNKFLASDRHILEKLAYDDLPRMRWQELMSELDLSAIQLDERIAKLVTSDRAKNWQIKKVATEHREQIMLRA